MNMDERQVIARIQKMLGLSHPGLNLRDDAAYFLPSGKTHLVVTTDLRVEGVHFSFQYMRLWHAGWRVVVANVSDVAAMGAHPTYFLLALGLPSDFSQESLNELLGGVKDACTHFGISLIGGDTVTSPGPLILGGMALGETEKPVGRSGAKIGDVVAVTGCLGAMHAGWLACSRSLPHFSHLKHRFLEPMPRTREGAILGQFAHAMLDISDGLSSDAHRLSEESGCAIVLDAERIPVAPYVKSFARKIGKSPLSIALASGEEYELLLALPLEDVNKAKRACHRKLYCPFTVIGKVRKGSGVYLNQNGKETRLQETGYRHSFS